MHELAITESVVAGVSERVGRSRVLRVVLEIGALSAVMPDSIRFCFDVCSKGTQLEGASLEILEIPCRGRCRACRRDVEMRGAVLLCECGETDVDIVSGRELRVLRVEVA